MNAPQPCVVTWNNYPAMLEQICSERWASMGLRRSCECASNEFSGHCLALTLLGSYLTDAYNGDIRFRKEVSERLAHDVRQGVHARKVMESYQNWLREGPELSVAPHVRPV